MKVLFLDHFGVMCLAHKHGKEREKTELPSYEELNGRIPFENFNKEAIEVLNSIILATNTEIVVTSDWRLSVTLEEMQRFYLNQGIIRAPIDFTQKLQINTSLHETRALEVLKWLKENTVTQWVCIDDIYLNLSNFVWVTRSDQGIMQKDIKDQIIRYLNI